MSKENGFQEHMGYPSVPSAPPTYAEAMYQENPPFVAPAPGFAVPPASSAAGSSYYPSPPIIEIQRTVVTLPLGPESARIRCPHCHADVLTRTDSEPSCAAHLCCLLILLIGCCPFSSLPYCMESLKNVRHSCPNCKVFLGSYQP